MDIIVYGKNAVRESVTSGNVKKLYIDSRHKKDPLVLFACGKNIPVELSCYTNLTQIARNPSHQGFVAICPKIPFYDLSFLIEKGKSKEYPLILMLDGIEDPHNLGAVIRSCDVFGADGVIIKKKGGAPLGPTVAKVSSGAVNYVPVAQVANLSNAIATLKEQGYWVVAAEGDGQSCYDQVDYKCPILLIIGSEGFGISKLVKQRSDFIVSIPMLGKLNSLNASVSAGIILSEIRRQQRNK